VGTGHSVLLSSTSSTQSGMRSLKIGELNVIRDSRRCTDVHQVDQDVRQPEGRHLKPDSGHTRRRTALLRRPGDSRQKSLAGRMRKKPRRCLNCQLLTIRHLAADVTRRRHCGMCERTTKQLMFETNRDAFWCVSCNSPGHMSWTGCAWHSWQPAVAWRTWTPEYSTILPRPGGMDMEQQPGHGDFDATSQ